MDDATMISDPDVLLCDILERWPQTIPVFIRHRMLCVGCAITPFHTIGDACAEHGVPEAAFREDLRLAIQPH